MSAARLDEDAEKRIDDAAQRLADELAARGVGAPVLGLVLGSGLGGLADAVQGGGAAGAEELEWLPRSTVPGHAGRLVWGELAGVPVIVQQGRVHLYEGHASRVVTRVVQACARLGVRGLVLTNSAGGLRADWAAGTLMRIEDSIDLQRRAPLVAGRGGSGAIWDAELGAALDEAARLEGVAL